MNISELTDNQMALYRKLVIVGVSNDDIRNIFKLTDIECRQFHQRELKHTHLISNPVTYISDQHTRCAVCGTDKHTPLRRDEMGGYVCLTCIDKRLNEFDDFKVYN